LAGKWQSPRQAADIVKQRPVKAIAFILIVIACGGLLAWLSVVVRTAAPARELELIPSSWLVSRVGDTAIPSEERARVTFGVNVVKVELPCGSISDVLVMDTDGAAMDLLDDAALARACDGKTSAVERTQLEAIRDVFHWRIETHDRIVLQGGPDVVLERASDGSTPTSSRRPPSLW
jgi:hypothetical protein